MQRRSRAARQSHAARATASAPRRLEQALELFATTTISTARRAVFGARRRRIRRRRRRARGRVLRRGDRAVRAARQQGAARVSLGEPRRLRSGAWRSRSGCGTRRAGDRAPTRERRRRRARGLAREPRARGADARRRRDARACTWASRSRSRAGSAISCCSRTALGAAARARRADGEHALAARLVGASATHFARLGMPVPAEELRSTSSTLGGCAPRSARPRSRRRSPPAARAPFDDLIDEALDVHAD